MYPRILRKDLKRKRTMNLILLIFIILAATFIASSANNMVSVVTALDNFFEKAGVPDYWFAISDQKENKRFQNFAEENNYKATTQELIQILPEDVKINDKKFIYYNSLFLSQLKNSTKIFDKNDKEITKINDGEIYITSEIFHSSKNKFKIGDTIHINTNGKSKSFIPTKGIPAQSERKSVQKTDGPDIIRFIVSNRRGYDPETDRSTIPKPRSAS